MERLLLLKRSSETCPHCGAVLERGEDGKCNTCRKPWPEQDGDDAATEGGEELVKGAAPRLLFINLWKAHDLSADPNPTPAQIEAGNYKKGHLRLHGLEISIENPKGSVRRGQDKNGKRWQVRMRCHYGYIRRMGLAADGDPVDVFIGPHQSSPCVFVIDQVRPDGAFDEHKVMLGFETLEEARRGYLANYTKGWKGLGAITEVSLPAFKAWLKGGGSREPFALQKAVDHPVHSSQMELPNMPAPEIPDEHVPLHHQYPTPEGAAEQAEARGNHLVYRLVSHPMEAQEILRGMKSGNHAEGFRAASIVGGHQAGKKRAAIDRAERQGAVPVFTSPYPTVSQMYSHGWDKWNQNSPAYGPSANLLLAIEHDPKGVIHRSSRAGDTQGAAYSATFPDAEHVIDARSIKRVSVVSPEQREHLRAHIDHFSGMIRRTGNRNAYRDSDPALADHNLEESRNLRPVKRRLGRPFLEEPVPIGNNRVGIKKGDKIRTSTGATAVLTDLRHREGENGEKIPIYTQLKSVKGKLPTDHLEGWYPQYNGEDREKHLQGHVQVNFPLHHIAEVYHKESKQWHPVEHTHAEQWTGNKWERVPLKKGGWLRRLAGRFLLMKGAQPPAPAPPPEPHHTHYYRAATDTNSRQHFGVDWDHSSPTEGYLVHHHGQHIGTIRPTERTNDYEAIHHPTGHTLRGFGSDHVAEALENHHLEHLRSTGQMPEAPHAHPKLYSNLRRVIEAKMPHKAPADQVHNLLRSHGITQDEITWTGAGEHLDIARENGGTVHKHHLLTHIDRNTPNLHEEFHLPRHGGKYSEYTHPGGENYREWLVKMPHNLHSNRDYQHEHWMEHDNVLLHMRTKDFPTHDGKRALHLEELQSDWHQQGREQGYAPVHGEHVRKRREIETRADEAILAHREARDAHEAALNAHRSAEKEWMAKYPLTHRITHPRTGEVIYEGPAGQDGSEDIKRKRQLSLEHGLRLDDEYIPHPDEPKENPEHLRTLQEAAKRAYFRRSETERRVQEVRRELEAHDQTAQSGLPPAPHADTWHELGLKRLLHHAAAHGYDKLTWTTGGQQADRFNLAHHVDQLQYYPDRHVLSASKDGKYYDLGTGGIVRPDRLHTVVGKEVAQKLLSHETRNHHPDEDMPAYMQGWQIHAHPGEDPDRDVDDPFYTISHEGRHQDHKFETRRQALQHIHEHLRNEHRLRFDYEDDDYEPDRIEGHEIMHGDRTVGHIQEAEDGPGVVGHLHWGGAQKFRGDNFDDVHRQMEAHYFGDKERREIPDHLADHHEEPIHTLNLDPKVPIGGEGMRNFYDPGGKSSQNLPRFLEKYTKRWGGKVGQTQILSLDPDKRPRFTVHPQELEEDDGTTSHHFVLSDNDREEIEGVYHNREEAEREATRLNTHHLSTPITVHSLDITPQMREHILTHGQPLWGTRNALEKSFLLLFRRLHKSQAPPKGLAQAARRIRHSGNYGRYGMLWWNPEQAAVHWTMADSDCEDSHSTSEEIKHLLGSVPGVRKVQLGDEWSPKEEEGWQRVKLEKSLVLVKTHVKASQRHLKSGKVVLVREHEDSRRTPPPRVHPTLGLPIATPEQIEEGRRRGVVIPPTSYGLEFKPEGEKQVATWRDLKGRMQAAYSAEAVAAREEKKFGKVAAFEAALPQIRAQVKEDLARPDTTLLHHACAAIVALIDQTAMRVGSEQYASENGTYGASSLRKSHVSAKSATATISFVGKHHVEHDKTVTGTALVNALKEFLATPGDRLFQYRRGDQFLPVTEQHVNAYLSRFGVTAKQFRTYQATVMARELFQKAGRPGSAKEAKQVVKAVATEVSAHLGNTPAVCLSSYIDPAEVTSYLGQVAEAPALAPTGGAK